MKRNNRIFDCMNLNKTQPDENLFIKSFETAKTCSHASLCFVNLGKSKELPVVAGPEPHTPKTLPNHTLPKPTRPNHTQQKHNHLNHTLLNRGFCLIQYQWEAVHFRVQQLTLLRLAYGPRLWFSSRAFGREWSRCRSFGRGDPRSCRAPAPRSSNRGFPGTACASARPSFARTILHARTVPPPRRRVMWFLFGDSRQWKQSRCFGC